MNLFAYGCFGSQHHSMLYAAWSLLDSFLTDELYLHEKRIAPFQLAMNEYLLDRISIIERSKESRKWLRNER
jgi:hypothetical protein